MTKKIVETVAKIKSGKQKKLKLGNLDAKRDWGYAPNYVEAMWLMLQQKEASDYVIATGKSHSVESFLEMSFEYAGLGDWHDYVEINEKYIRPRDIDNLVGDASKANKILNWKPEMNLKGLALRADHETVEPDAPCGCEVSWSAVVELMRESASRGRRL